MKYVLFKKWACSKIMRWLFNNKYNDSLRYGYYYICTDISTRKYSHFNEKTKESYLLSYLPFYSVF